MADMEVQNLNELLQIRRDKLTELQEAGITSVKLEGRLKRPEYVSVVTESYRKGLDSLDRGAFEKADEKEKEGLRTAACYHLGPRSPEERVSQREKTASKET